MTGSVSLAEKTLGTFQVLVSVPLLVILMITGCKDQGIVEQPPEPPTEEPGILYDVSGKAGSYGFAGDGGPASEARLYWPIDIYVHPTDRDLYIVDWNNQVYRKVTSDGTISTVIGSGILGDDFDGPARSMNLNHPTDIIVGPDGDLYIAAWHNWKIKRIERSTNYAVSVAGTDAGFAGDGDKATLAALNLPSSCVFDPAGNMFISDQGNNRIRKVNTGGIITTLAGRLEQGWRDGSGLLAKFNLQRGPDALPGGKLAITPEGDYLYMADQQNHRIRKIDIATSDVTTVAGTGEAGYSGDGSLATNAQLNFPCDVACAPNGDIYVADVRNHVVRKIDTSGIITTVAGTGVAGFSPNGTLANEAMLNNPFGVFFDGSTNTLYIADTYNSQVKKVKML
jgi:DNA-binding beta-propeller fold protein YncE